MKASPAHSKILSCLALLAVVSLIAPALAQDVVTLKDGTKRQGSITGISGGNIRIQTETAAGRVESSVPLANVASVNMNPPADLLKAEDEWKKGKADAAFALLNPLVQRFTGLPAPWVQRATLLLIDAMLETGKAADAERLLVDFQKAYPDSGDATALIRAKIAIARNNFVGAKPLLTPIIEQARKTNLADTTESVKFGQAFFLMGKIREQEGDLAGALDDYLHATVLFYADSATASRAQARADELAAKNIVVP